MDMQAFQEDPILTTPHVYAVKLPLPCFPRGPNPYHTPRICSQTALHPIYMQSNCLFHAFQEAQILSTPHTYAVKLPLPCFPRGRNPYHTPHIRNQTASSMLSKRPQSLPHPIYMQSNCLFHACQEVPILTTPHTYAVKLHLPCFARGPNP